MANQTKVKVGGKYVAITNFERTGSFASGRVHGKEVSVYVPVTYKDYEAKHAIIDESNRLYGDELCDNSIKAQLARESWRENQRVKESHIENLGNGVSRGTAKVDGEDVSVLYTGTVMNDHGEVLGAKPWLSDFRKDAIAAKDMKDGKVYKFPDKTFVDTEFVQMLISEKNMRVEKGVVFIGQERIKIKGLKKLDAAKEIKAAIERYNEEQERMQTELDEMLACI